MNLIKQTEPQINGLFYDIMETQTGFNKTTQTYENSD